MIDTLKRAEYVQLFRSLKQSQIKYREPVILKMYGALNKMNLIIENRYILCNFLDQNSDIIDLKEDIYLTNNEKSLNQLFLLAINKAKKYNLVNALYEEYLDSVNAISSKEDFFNQ